MYTKPFNEINKDDVSIAGGKGASLGEMTQAGIPVPPGFVVLSNSFEKFMETGLNVEIQSELDKVNINDVNSIGEASERIRSEIMLKEIPEDIKKEIINEFEKLKCEFVAVRSSATSEDSKDAAWAGQLETYLNTTKDNLIENVKKCFSSLFTPRAIFYRLEKKIKDKVSVAVVVQKMVQSEISGIAFSVHPVTQDYNQMIIEAGIGLGEAIVSGQVTPDNYVVDKQMNIIDINVGEQEKALVKKDNENVWITINNEEQKLTGKEIIELAGIILNIEKHYGFPVDVEWAKTDKFYITQSRPITTLI